MMPITKCYQVVTERLHHCHLLQEKPAGALWEGAGLGRSTFHFLCPGWAIIVVCGTASMRRRKGIAWVTLGFSCPPRRLFLQSSEYCVGSAGTAHIRKKIQSQRPYEGITEHQWDLHCVNIIVSKLSVLCSLCCPSGATPKPIYFGRRMSHLNSWVPAILRD